MAFPGDEDLPMKKCSVCGKEGDLDFLERCEPCFRDYVMNVKDSRFRPGVLKNGYTVTEAHYDDIKRRRIGDDGQVYRDYGRKSFTV